MKRFKAMLECLKWIVSNPDLCPVCHHQRIFHMDGNVTLGSAGTICRVESCTQWPPCESLWK